MLCWLNHSVNAFPVTTQFIPCIHFPITDVKRIWLPDMFIRSMFLISRHKVDGSAISKQLPSLILYEGGKETKRRPLVDRRGVITKYTFTEVWISTCPNRTLWLQGMEEKGALTRGPNRQTLWSSRSSCEIYSAIFV